MWKPTSHDVLRVTIKQGKETRTVRLLTHGKMWLVCDFGSASGPSKKFYDKVVPTGSCPTTWKTDDKPLKHTAVHPLFADRWNKDRTYRAGDTKPIVFFERAHPETRDLTYLSGQMHCQSVSYQWVRSINRKICSMARGPVGKEWALNVF